MYATVQLALPSLFTARTHIVPEPAAVGVPVIEPSAPAVGKETSIPRRRTPDQRIGRLRISGRAGNCNAGNRGAYRPVGIVARIVREGGSHGSRFEGDAGDSELSCGVICTGLPYAI